MYVDQTNLTWTLMLLSLSGALYSEYCVEYQQQPICAVKGSSVLIPCSFHYPDNHRVKEVMWSHDSNIYDGPFIYDSNVTNNSLRFQYIGNKHHNCSLKVQQVEHHDAGKYAFRFITDQDKLTGQAGSTLNVVDLKILVTKPHGNRTTKEGDSVNLTCINDCNGDHLSSGFTWFKNRKPINEGPGLYLSNMSSTDSGNYTCSLKTHSGATSGVTNIDVEYGPKNISVSVRPSMEVDAGSNITLICSSHANPPAENYTWFKIDDDHITTVGHQPVFVSGDGGRYFCSATNTHGSQNSTDVTLRIRPNWATFNRHVLIITTVTVLLIVTAVVVARRLKKKRTRAPETICEEDIQSTVYVNWPVFDKIQSQEENEVATTEVIYATVNFHTKGKSNMEQQMDSHCDDDNVIYSTVCSNQMWNPP